MAKQTGVPADPLSRAGALLRRLLRLARYTLFCLGRIQSEIRSDYGRFQQSLEPERVSRPAHQTLAAWARWLAGWVGSLVQRTASVVWRQFRNVAVYYGSRVRRFRTYVTEFFEGMQDPQQRQVEVRISPGMNFAAAEHLKGRWHVEMPERCFVCAVSTNRPRQQRFVRLEDVAGPFWCVVAGVIGGLLLSFSRWSPWPLVIGCIGGPLLGYQCRRYVDVLISYLRCSEHAEPPTPPAMRVFGDQLILRATNKTVRLDVRQTHATRAEAMQHAVRETVIIPEPEKIQLADGSDTPIVPERTIPLASSDGDDDDEQSKHDGRRGLP